MCQQLIVDPSMRVGACDSCFQLTMVVEISSTTHEMFIKVFYITTIQFKEV